MIIGLCGKAGVGKDETARHLILKHEFTRFAFADKLKELAIEINPRVYSTTLDRYLTLRALVQFHGWDAAKREPHVREHLQNLGHGARTTLSETIWIQAIEQDVLSASNVVLTDCRYLNEAAWVLSQGGFLVEITREDAPAVRQHATEERLDLHYDYHIMNNGTIRDLGNAVDVMLAHISEVLAFQPRTV